MPKLIASNLTLEEFERLARVNECRLEVIGEVNTDDNGVNCCNEWWVWWKAKLIEHSFIMLIISAVLLALVYPKGASYLKPDITAGYIAVILIFLMTGISLKTEELMKSVSNMKFNSAVQIFNLGILTITVYGASRLFIMWGMNQDLANGMVICGEFKH
jgi:hypothetical protein